MLLSLLSGCTPDADPAVVEPVAHASTCAEATVVPKVERDLGDALFTFDGAPPRNILFIVTDTFRRDSLAFYGSDRQTMPCFAARSEHIVRFDAAWSTAPWTGPSTASLVTGLYPENHGVLRVDTSGTLGTIEPPLDAPSFAGALQAAGWSTALISGNGWVSADNGFDNGFDWANPWAGTRDRDNAEELASASRDWIAAVPAESPFFVHLQLYDNHYYYLPADQYVGRWLNLVLYPWSVDAVSEDEVLASYHTLSDGDKALAREWLRGLYDAETLEEDAEIERTLAALEDAGRLDDTLVVLVADHGESFAEEGKFGHGNSLRNELVRIPLLVYNPRLQGGVVTDIVRSIDVLPTVLAGVGLPVPEGIDGMAVTPGAGPTFAYGSHFPSSDGALPEPELTYAAAGTTKVVRVCATHEDRAFNLVSDPGELHPLPPANVPGAEALVDALDETVATLHAGREYAACTRE